MTMKNVVMVMATVFATVAFAQTETVVKLPGIQKIDMENLLDVPVGSTLLDTGIKRVTQEEDVLQIEVPLEWSEKAKCRALRVSHILVDNRRLIILGGLGSNVYPTIAEGAFAMTNEVISAVWKVSDGKAMAVPLRFDKQKCYWEMIFTWKPDPKKNVERELIVRGIVNTKRQMAVCTCLHTKGDTLRADFAQPKTGENRSDLFSPNRAVHQSGNMIN